MSDRLIDRLLPFQRRLADDPSRFVIALWSRQTGKGFTSSFIAVRTALTEPRHNWIIVAPTERQSAETLEKCKGWARAANVAIAETEQELEGLEGGVRMTARAIAFPNGNRICALPGRPASLRGFTGSLILDEFAIFENDEEVWAAAFPIIVNPMAGVKRVLITSTPKGRGNRFFRLVDENLMNPVEGRGVRWSVHRTTIHEAAKEWEETGRLAGRTAEQYVAELKANFDSPELWPQEYECEFLDSDNNLLTLQMITDAESAEASAASPWWLERGGEFYVGVDFGRTSDPTVAWTLERRGDLLVTREVLELRNMATERQFRELSPRFAAARLACLDYTGPGIGLGDLAVAAHGRRDPQRHDFGRVELCTFSAPFKRLIFPRLRKRFESPVTVRIPHSQEIRQDLNAMRQTVHAGDYTYWAPRTAEGHSDRCTALALAVRAAESGGGFMPSPVAVRAAAHGAATPRRFT